MGSRNQSSGGGEKKKRHYILFVTKNVEERKEGKEIYVKKNYHDVNIYLLVQWYKLCIT